MDDTYVNVRPKKYRQAWPIILALSMATGTLVFAFNNPDFVGGEITCWAMGNGTAYYVGTEAPEEFNKNVTQRYFVALISGVVLCFLIAGSQVLVLVNCRGGKQMRECFSLFLSFIYLIANVIVVWSPSGQVCKPVLPNTQKALIGMEVFAFGVCAVSIFILMITK